MTKQTKVLSDKDIREKIADIRKRGNNVQKDIQTAIIDCLTHAEANDGDFTLLTELYHALPVMVRRATFKAYVEAHAPTIFRTKKNKTGARYKVFLKNKSEDAPKFDLTPQKAWYEWEAPKGEDEADPLTLEEFITRMKSSITRLKNQAGENNTQVISMAEALETQLEQAQTKAA